MNKHKLIEELKDKEYRDAFVSELIDTGIPFQIKALREQRNWTQKELGEHAQKAQETVSRLENPNYAKFTLKTLKELASAFDIGLLVRFVPLSELVKWELDLSSESLEVTSYDEESYFNEEPDQDVDVTLLAEALNTIRSQTVVPFDEYKNKNSEMERLLNPFQTLSTDQQPLMGVR